MGPTGRPETSLTNLPPTPHNIPEEQRAHMDRRGRVQFPEDHFCAMFGIELVCIY